MAEMTSIELAAVGRVAGLGDIYDARSDQFLHFSIFKDSIPESDITSIQNRQTKLQYAFTNTMEEKFNKMDISAGLKLSIISGLFELEGSGKYFKDTKKSAKSAKASVINSISTEYERINIADESLQSFINLNVLEHINATHIVVGIQWGGYVFVSVEDMNIEDKDQLTVQGKLKAELTVLTGKISGDIHSNVDVNIGDNSELNNFNFEIFGDILPDKVPQNVIDALNFMTSATIALQTANNGKGKAIKYTLIPISSLRKLMKIESKIDLIINSVDEKTVRECIKLFEDINRIEQKINDTVDLVQQFEKCSSETKIEEIKNLQFNFQIYQTEIQKSLSENLILVRSGEEPIHKLQEVIFQANENQFSWKNTEKEFSRITKDIKLEISFFKYLLAMDIKLLEKNQELDEFLCSYHKNDVYILCYSEPNSRLIGKPIELMLELIEKKRKTDIFVAMNSNESKLMFYRNMRLITENYDENCLFPDGSETGLLSIPIMQNQLAKLLNNPDHKSHVKYRELASIDSNLLKKIKKFIIHNDDDGNTEVFLITHSDDVYAFGCNIGGKLGFGDKEEVKETKIIPELCGKKVIDIKCGNEFSVALTQTGQIYTFGYSSWGRTGNGDYRKIHKPIEISVDNQAVIAIDCTAGSTYVLTQSGQLYWFGYFNDNTVNYPTKVVFPSEVEIKSISCGGEHIFALNVDGKVFSWGDNDYGQLGLGRNNYKITLSYCQNTNIPQMIALNENIKQISCGWSHSLLLTTDGKLYSMGNNELGQLGIGNKENKNVPKLVLSDQKEICCFRDISMSFDINNRLYIWGKILCNKDGIESPFVTGLTSFQEVIDNYAEHHSTIKPLSSVEMFNPYYFKDINPHEGLFGKIQFYS